MRQWTRWAAAVLALLATSAAPARDEEDKAAAAKAFDTALNKSLRDVINRGAALYNKGDHAGCYRLFQGGLTAALGLLDHHPDLQKAVATALAGAERDPLVWRRAFTLRAALDKVRKGLAGKPDEKDKDKKDKEPSKDDDMKKEDETKEEKDKDKKKKEVEKKQKGKEGDD